MMLYNQTMVESIYVSALQLEGIEKSGANHLIVNDRDLNQVNWQVLQRLGPKLSIAINALDKDEQVCLLDPQVQERFLARLDAALQFNPEEIWIDRFRFGGDCTDIEETDAAKAHSSCQYCQGKSRTESILNIAQQVKSRVDGKAKLGLFAVAFKDDEGPQLAQALGVDYQKLGQVFDLFSPMLYHRMIGKPVSYISEYIKWLADRTGKPVLPVLQIKDMPDGLEDKMSEEEIEAAFKEAIKEPSIGVCFFWWTHALEKGKTGIISQLFSSAS